MNPDLARRTVENGFDQCTEVKDLQRSHGDPRGGMIVSVHEAPPEPQSRSDFIINWDGTIQSSWERNRALVLSIEEPGAEIVLANYMADTALRLSMAGCNIAVTGLQEPEFTPVPLLLGGEHSGRALVLVDTEVAHLGNRVDYVEIGRAEDALTVHLEANGVIRLEHTPNQAFGHQPGTTAVGTKLSIFHAHSGAGQRFVVNENATVSPFDDQKVVWGIRSGDLTLVAKDDPQATRITLTNRLSDPQTALAPVPKRQAPSTESCMLELSSHPGLALSVHSEPASAGASRLVLSPLKSAARFVVEPRRIRLANTEATLSLGLPSSTDFVH